MHQTERLNFNLLNVSFEKELEKLFCENEMVMKMALKGRVFSKEEFKQTLKEDFQQSKSDHAGFLCLTSKADDQVVGISGLLSCDYLNQENYEFGFVLDERFWGLGLATEIGQFWLEYSKEKMKLTEVLATVSPENKASRRVLEKLGMELVREIDSKERGNRLVFKKDLR